VTQLISTTVADCSRDCTLAALQGTDSFIKKMKLFPTITDWILGFMQNMLGNIIAFQRIYDKITTSIAASNIADVCF
jgi:hypothetical protein